MSVVLIGFKGCGKSTIGPLLAEKIGFSFHDLDHLIEQRHFEETGERQGFREVFRARGEESFRAMENHLLHEQLGREDLVLALGGGTPMATGVGSLLAPHCVVYLRVPENEIIERVRADGWPAYLENEAEPEEALRLLFKRRVPRYEELAKLVVENTRAPQEVVAAVLPEIRAVLAQPES